MIEYTEGQLERFRIEREIARLKLVQPFPTASAIESHRRHIEDLEEQLRHLPPVPRDPEPPSLPG